MSRMFFAATAIALTAAAPALADERQFTENGVDYTYTAEVDGNTRILTGTASGAPFRLIVKNGWVRGQFDGRKVLFAEPATNRGSATSAR